MRDHPVLLPHLISDEMNLIELTWLSSSEIQAEPDLYNSCFPILISLVTSHWDKTFGKQFGD